jgi:hypothetical protein
MDKVSIIQSDMPEMVADATSWLRRLRLARRALMVSGVPMDGLVAQFEAWRASSPCTGRALRLASLAPALPPMKAPSYARRAYLRAVA